jgi:hypothetical protein
LNGIENNTNSVKSLSDHEFVDTNSFLNTATSSPNSESLNISSIQLQTSPYVTSPGPDSPLLFPNASNTTTTTTTTNSINQNHQNITNNSFDSNATDSFNVNNYKRSLSSLKTSSTSTQMTDHVESLQIDLNSIKEFFEKNLSNNTLNQIDSYTINNLFSPIILDQLENDQAPFCLEAAPLASASVNTSNNSYMEYANSNNDNNNNNNYSNGGEQLLSLRVTMTNDNNNNHQQQPSTNNNNSNGKIIDLKTQFNPRML